MFARATSRSYTCLRCQHRLALRECLPADNTTFVKRVPRRWQSSAAEAIVENEEHDEDLREITGGESYSRSRKPYATRRWRPAPTAEIGVDVLGKPGEILVLPDVGRKRRKANTESIARENEEDADEGNEEQTSADSNEPRVHETLALESMPVSTREALANIAQIRIYAEQAATGRSLGEDQWVKYYKALSKGFTRKQLHQYISENASASDSDSPQHESNVAAFTKAQAAKDIMTRIWGLVDDLPQEPERHVSKAFNMGWGKRELILGNESQWRRLLNHMSITPSSTRGWVDMTGPESWVRRAQFIFQNLRAKVRAQVLAIPPHFRKALKDPASPSGRLARSMLQDLVQEHEISVTKGTEWVGYAFSAERIARFERDLVLRQREYFSELGMTKTSLPLSLQSLDESSVMPVHKISTRRRLPELYRYVQNRPISDIGDTETLADLENIEFQDLVYNLRGQTCGEDLDTFDYTFPSGSKSEIGHSTTAFTVEIGQALHRLNSYEHEISEAAEDSSSEVVSFTSRVPFLPVFLNQQIPHVSEDDSSIINEHLIQLTFVPSDPLTQPSLKVQATIPTTTTSKTSIPLSIRSVQFSFPSRIAHIALPTTPFDLKLTRHTYVPIFEIGTPMQKSYAPLLSQLAAQLKTQEKVRNPALLADLNTLLDLDLSCLKSPLITGDTTTETESTTASTATEDQSENPSEKSADKKNADPVLLTRYALDKAELLETRVYEVSSSSAAAEPVKAAATPETSDLPSSSPGLQPQSLLEYTSAMPLLWSSEQEWKETLKISESDGALLLRDQDKFAAFVKGAVDVVDVLNRFVDTRAEELTSESGEKNEDETVGDEKKDKQEEEV